MTHPDHIKTETIFTPGAGTFTYCYMKEYLEISNKDTSWLAIPIKKKKGEYCNARVKWSQSPKWCAVIPPSSYSLKNSEDHLIKDIEEEHFQDKIKHWLQKINDQKEL